MAQRTGASVHIHLVMRQIEIVHGRQDNDSECFIDLEKVNIFRGPTDALQQFRNRADGSSREIAGRAGICGATWNPGQRRQR